MIGAYQYTQHFPLFTHQSLHTVSTVVMLTRCGNCYTVFGCQDVVKAAMEQVGRSEHAFDIDAEPEPVPVECGAGDAGIAAAADDDDVDDGFGFDGDDNDYNDNDGYKGL